MIKEEKRKYIFQKIASSNSSKELFNTFNDLIGKKKNNSLPVDVPKNELPNTFNTFFTDKIEKIRNKLDQIPTQFFFQEIQRSHLKLIHSGHRRIRQKDSLKM